MSQNITRIGIDLAKNIFQVCAVNKFGKVIYNKTIKRPKLGVVRLNRTRHRKSRHSRILTSIKTTPLGKSGFAVLFKIVSTVEVTFLIKVVVN